jgi:nicotinate-nucleotide--dimethylbenzimidazole phosphoribosyltransferase
MMNFNIQPVSKDLKSALEQKIDLKTKPLGSLGILENIAFQIGSVQQTLHPKLEKPSIVIFAGDHGIVAEGVSPYPQEVTYQMVFNFLKGGAAINVFARQHNIGIKVVDAGVNFNFEPHPDLVDAKIAKGTKNYLTEFAMSLPQCIEAIKKGSAITEEIHNDGTNIIGFGEMGIGNTSSASIIMSLLCNLPLDVCVGSGTGLDQKGILKKRSILEKALAAHAFEYSPINILAAFGGFEIVMMCGAMLKAAELGMVVLVDGFIASSALLAASKINANIMDYCIFTHCSNEKGHALMLENMNAKAIINLEMRLGEGTGVAVCYPLIQSAVNFLNEMASFESAGVSVKEVVK